MNRQIRRLGLAMLVLYTGLFLMLNWVQVIKADEYNDNPNNTREILRDFSADRGQILSADDAVLARTVPSDDRFEKQREYPEGELFATLTGYFAFNLGATGIEKAYNDELAGQTFELEVQNLRDLFVDRTRVADVTISVRKDVQEVARQQLGERPGAVVALDPRTGSILAMWSYPSFDPNLLATHDLEQADENAQLLENFAPNRPLAARSYRERYFPGSTFKVVTASAGLESGQVTPEQPSYPVESSHTPPLTTRPLQNFGGSTCGGTLFDILRVSCNTSFARMGVDLGPEVMVATAESFGFNARPPIDLEPGAVPSVFPEVGFFDQNTPALAQSAIGQNSVQATPLEMALVASAFANGGEIMRPRVMSEIRDSDGEVVETANAERWRTAVSPGTAETMKQAMIGVVQNGTARGLAIPGMEVGGKTGTAQLGSDPPRSHAWIIGFAGPPGDPQVAVAVIVEGQPGASEQTGGRVAAPIARAVMEKILQVRAQETQPAAPPG